MFKSKKPLFIIVSAAALLLSSCQSSCDEHVFSKDESKSTTPTIIEKGVNYYRCDKCGKSKKEDVYDLNEYAFDNQIFMYDGYDHQITIKGMIPYGTTVEYENNSLKEIGSKEATAKVYNEKHQLIDTKKATITIVENTGFPNVRIDTNNVAVTSKEEYVTMTLSTDNCLSKYQMNSVPGEVRCRGNGTMTYDKKAYRIKFTSKNNMLGLNNEAKAKSWVFLADYADQSMLRNETMFYLGDSLFNYSNNYSSDYMHVNVYLNGKYNGVYLLAEQQQANKNRIILNEAEDDYTGTDVGYLLELDHYADQEDYHFSVGKATSGGFGPGSQISGGDKLDGTTMPQKEYTIKTDCFSNDQVNYIKKYLTNVYYAFLKAVSGEGLYVLDEQHELIQSPYKTMYETLNSMIDLESVFKMYIIHELMKSVDVGYSSFYMFVDFSAGSRYKRLTFGAPWDFDWSSGNVNESLQMATDGNYCSRDFNHMNPWFFMLAKTNFFNEYMRKYYHVFANSKIFESALAQNNYEANAFSDQFKANYDKWKNLGQVTPKYTPDSVKKFKVHKDAVDYLNDWLIKRKTYLDNTWLK